MRAVLLLSVFLALLSLGGCRSSSKNDVLSKVPGANDGDSGVRYEKPEGVEFHIPAILGMKYSEFKGSEMETYLGAPQDEIKLPGVRGRQIRYGQGEVYVARDEIYEVAYEYPRPVTRVEAVHLTGLPESLAAEFKPAALELRIERSPYGYRRLILTRAAPDEERFTRIEAWKFLPPERF